MDSTELEAHFVGGLEAEGFVERPSGRAGVERDGREPVGAAPVEHDAEELPGKAATPRMRLRIHVEDPGALREGFSGESRPASEDDSAPGHDFAFGLFRKPGFVAAFVKSLLEIFPRGRVHGLEN